ncbi:histidine kinase [Bradyrhizobium sp. YR681]|uniref:two-component system VirA-like sensor kinase n=1 Tax=Bradyrhizobium sp. YR681 TaxID=1144344 RepID=UPI00026F97A1|nr:two-component system VirA-like sensor kinase [Bradyrhizobium sp. YR681]EJN10587.1 histidine kinase [Bradyrhizobium sp. YR681]
MKVAPATVGVTFLLALLTWLLLNGLNLNSDRYDRQTQALADFTRFERGMSREVLTSRAGLSRNYDGLVEMMDAYDAALVRLREAAGTDREQIAAIDVLAARAARQEELIEQFKSKNALLRNSFTYFSLFSARLSSSNDRPLVADVSALAAAMLQLTLDTSEATARELQARLDSLARLQIASEDNELLHAAVAHGQLLHDLLPDVDAILKMLVAEASNREQDVVHALIVKRQLAARVAARKNRLLQYLTSLLLLGALVYFGLLLRARAKALRRRAAFEHVIASISMRFIETHRDGLRGHVESALEELAGFIGADRAYFAPSAAKNDNSYRWAREGVRFDESWPGRALDLAQRFDGGEDAIIYIPRVRPSHPEDLAHLLDEAGIRGWLCIKTLSGEGQAAILGFDVVEAAALSQWAEFALFRTAFDAIGNAVGRVVLEQEKERLQASLQQARRMETIGTFASGIAHNFNNIVGAILGYVEIADTGIRSGSRSAASLAEIRRAGERARELVGQILTFGRRNQGPQERICIRTLVAETKALLAASLPPHVQLMVSQLAESVTVSGEPAQLQQVIINLCNNAAQAMAEPGFIDLQIAERDVIRPVQIGRTELRSGRFAIISVSDPGPGMDEATLEQVFEPFFTTRSEGNGLGLATVREIVEQHGGAVTVRSTPGAGTRFDIWLPCGSSSEPISVPHAPSLALRGAGEAVLVLEADRKRLLRYEEILAALGYEPVGFSVLAEAEAACRAAPMRFDVALVCHVPGGSSLDLAYLLHDAAPRLPIILASPSVHHFAARLLATAGVTELVHHPLMSAELAVALSRCLATSAIGDRAKRIVAAG